MSAFGGKADICPKLLTRDEAVSNSSAIMANFDYLEKSASNCLTFGSPCHADHRSSNDPFAGAGVVGLVVTVRSEAALNLLRLADVIAILMTIQLNAARRHVTSQANVILTLLFRVPPHTSSGSHLFRAMPNDTHV